MAGEEQAGELLLTWYCLSGWLCQLLCTFDVNNKTTHKPSSWLAGLHFDALPCSHSAPPTTDTPKRHLAPKRKSWGGGMLFISTNLPLHNICCPTVAQYLLSYPVARSIGPRQALKISKALQSTPCVVGYLFSVLLSAVDLGCDLICWCAGGV